ncbi:hypothetical protein BH11ARM1_BH11ARM1_17580 [soil metagenome]
MSNGARLTVAIVALLCALGFGMTAYTAGDAFPNPNAIYGCAVVCLVIALSCLRGPCGTVVWCVLAGAICLLDVAYVVKEMSAPAPVVLSGSRAKPSIVNAIAGFVLLGVPSGLYAILGDKLVDWFKSISQK